MNLDDNGRTILKSKIKDDRIILFEESLTRKELLHLMDCCDVYISLHRSEGQGLTILEAMELGKPTIITAYSGNIDFTHINNSCLVPYTLIPVAVKACLEADHQFPA